MSNIDENRKKADRMRRKTPYPQDKIMRSRVWKWLTIIGTILGIVTAGWFLYDELFVEKRDVMIEHRDGSLTIEQTVDPEVLRMHRESGDTTVLEKRVIIPPEEEGNDTNR